MPNARLGSTKSERFNDLLLVVEISINLILASSVAGKHRNATKRSIFAIWPCPRGHEFNSDEAVPSILDPGIRTKAWIFAVYTGWSGPLASCFIKTGKIKP